MENMALRAAMRQWRSTRRNIVMGGKRSFASSTSTQATQHAHDQDQPKPSRLALKAEYTPVYVVFGMVFVAVCIGAHTAKQQLLHAPSVQVNKRRREVVPEVDHPDDVVGCSDKFINKSFLRKVGHIQERDPAHIPSPRPADPFTRSRDVETLKSVGVAESQKKKHI